LRLLDAMRFDLRHVFGTLHTRWQQKGTDIVPLMLDDDVRDAMLAWRTENGGGAEEASLESARAKL
jgi:hypothetical protein